MWVRGFAINLPAFYRAVLDDAATEILRLISRDLDRGAPATAENWHVVGIRRPAE